MHMSFYMSTRTQTREPCLEVLGAPFWVHLSSGHNKSIVRTQTRARAPTHTPTHMAIRRSMYVYASVHVLVCVYAHAHGYTRIAL